MAAALAKHLSEYLQVIRFRWSEKNYYTGTNKAVRSTSDIIDGWPGVYCGYYLLQDNELCTLDKSKIKSSKLLLMVWVPYAWIDMYLKKDLVCQSANEWWWVETFLKKQWLQESTEHIFVTYCPAEENLHLSRKVRRLCIDSVSLATCIVKIQSAYVFYPMKRWKCFISKWNEWRLIIIAIHATCTMKMKRRYDDNGTLHPLSADPQLPYPKLHDLHSRAIIVSVAPCQQTDSFNTSSLNEIQNAYCGSH